MKLRQIFLALSLVPMMQMSTATAQRIAVEGDETGDAFFQPRLAVETAKANAPDAPAAESADASLKPPVSLSPVPVPTPIRRIGFRNKMYENSYMDAYRILKEENACSRFFGGAANATEVLNRFTDQLSKRRFDSPDVAVEMSGAVVFVQDYRTGAAYRLFEHVTINSIGPLYVPPIVAQGHRRSIGRFPSDTRAARALILLHELGHLVRGAQGGWLLPNDGHDAELSGQNTNTVESYCLKQLTALKH
jgi:hypothetical protein